MQSSQPSLRLGCIFKASFTVARSANKGASWCPCSLTLPFTQVGRPRQHSQVDSLFPEHPGYSDYVPIRSRDSQVSVVRARECAQSVSLIPTRKIVLFSLHPHVRAAVLLTLACRTHLLRADNDATSMRYLLNWRAAVPPVL